MSEKKYGSPLLALSYGTKETVDHDVNLFEAFYEKHFHEDILAKFEERKGNQSKILASALCAGSLLFVIPMLINPSSIFAVILLAMGGLLLVVGLMYLHRVFTIKKYCEKNFDRLLKRELAATRSVTKRVFDIGLYEHVIVVEFGSKTAIKQTRSKRYEEIKGVYLTNELIFIQGLTWMAVFQMEAKEFNEMCSLLEEKCADIFHDRRKEE